MPDRPRAPHEPNEATQPKLPTVAVVMMSRLRASSVPWALWRLARRAAGLGRVPGMRFARVMGSGRDGGFGLKPGLNCQGVFALFDDVGSARHFLEHSAAARSYQSRSVESFAAVLKASSVRGTWGGQGMAVDVAAQMLSDAAQNDGPIAVLTRAAIRPRHLLQFWRHSPGTEAELDGAPGCRLAVGIGEAPLMRQATFSLWDNAAAMDLYARQGAHQRAIQAAWSGGYFSEWMFVRFVPLWMRGSWRGRDLTFTTAVLP